MSRGLSSLYYDIDHGTLEYFSPENLDFVQDRVRQKFFERYGRNYMVPKESIIPVMRAIYVNDFRQPHEMTDIVVNIVFSAYKNEMDFEFASQQLDKWAVTTWQPYLCIQQTNVQQGKIQNRDYTKGWFSMNY